MEAPAGSLHHFGDHQTPSAPCPSFPPNNYPEGPLFSQQPQRTVITRVPGPKQRKRRAESGGAEEEEESAGVDGAETPSAPSSRSSSSASSASAPLGGSLQQSSSAPQPQYPSDECPPPSATTTTEYHNLGQQSRMEDNSCWAELNTMGRNLIRDEFIGLAAYPPPPCSPLSASMASTEFYECSTNSGNGSSNPILDDPFLSRCTAPTSLLLDAAPACCSGFSAFSAVHGTHPLPQFPPHDGDSVGISPCSSSSTQISSVSSSSTTDDPLFPPIIPATLRPHYQHHQPLHPQHSNGIFGSLQFAPQQMDGVVTLTGFGGGPKPMEAIGIMDGDTGYDNNHYRPPVDDEQDEDEEEPRDVKPTLYTMTTTGTGQKRDQQQNGGVQEGAGNGGSTVTVINFPMTMTGDNGESPPPPPSPLTPPNKMRSKMHDLALKHRLITNQNVRGHGIIHLSTEEKKTLIQEGFSIPTKLPLMREEEEALKIVRRKIKNKLSAQESRRKRKEYMDMLEKRVHAYFADNTQLRQKVRALEAQNRFLASQLQQIQNGEEGAAEAGANNNDGEGQQ